MFKWWVQFDTADAPVRRNFFLNLFDGGLYAFGMSLVALNTVIPVFVKKIGGTNIAVGMIPVIWIIGNNFPQIFIANYTRRQSFKKPLQIRMAFFQRLPYLLIAVLIYMNLATFGSGGATILFLGCLFITAVCSSLNLPGWFDLISKLTPVSLRGRLFAMRALLGALLGFLGGWLVKFILDTVAYPNNYALLFFCAFTVMMVSYIFLLLLQEKEANPPKTMYTHKAFIKYLPQIIKSDKNFRNFLYADALMIMAMTADSFYAVNAFSKFHLSDGFAGKFTVVIMSSLVIGNFVFGHLADRHGHRLTLSLAALATMTACLIALTAGSLSLYYIVFICTGFTVGLIHVSRLTIIAELCGEQERATYVALANMLTAPFVLIGIGSGWLADVYGYNVVFFVAGTFALLSALFWRYKVTEPRHLGINEGLYKKEFR